MPVTVVTVVDGEFDVTVANQLVRVFVPPGLGVAGVDDETFVAHVMDVLVRANHAIPAVIDLSQVIAANPFVLQQVADALDDSDTDTV